MTKFDHYDRNGVYELIISTGAKQTLVVTDRDGNSITGYVAEAGSDRSGDREVLRVDDQPIQFRREAVIGKKFIGGFRSFDVYEFPTGEPTHLILEVPEDARDDVDFEYKPVSCPGDDPEVDVEPGSCDWSGDFRETLAGDACPACGTTIEDPDA